MTIAFNLNTGELIKNIVASPLFKSSLIFSISNALNSAIPFLLIPILTRYLDQREYGIITMFQLISSLLSTVIGFNAHNAAIIQSYKKEEIDFPKYVYNAIIIIFLSFLLSIAATFLIKRWISESIFFPEDWIFATVIFATCQVLFQLLLGLFISSQKPFSYGVFQVSQTLLNLGLSLLLVVYFNLGWEGRVFAQVFVYSLFGVITICILWRQGNIKLKIDGTYIKRIIRFGLPLIPHTLAGSLMIMTDRFLISKLVSIEQVGVYMVGYQFAQILLLLQDSVNNALAPWIFKNIKQNTVKEKIRLVKGTYLYMVSILLFSITYSLSIPPIFRVFVGKEFLEGEQYIFWLALAFAFNGMYKMVVNYIFYVEKTYILGFITTATALVNLLLSYYLINLYGAIGVAYSCAISYLISFLLTWYYSNKVFPMPWRLR